MRGTSVGSIAVTALLALPAYAEQKRCELRQYAEIPVTMSGTQPMVAGTINGSPAVFLADSGAVFSMISREAAQEYGLEVGPLPPQLAITGIGGAATVGLATVRDFTLKGFLGGRVIKNVQFMVGGNVFAGDAAGLLGQNVLGSDDTEYDLANGFIRIFRVKDCGDRMLAYWHGTAHVAVIGIDRRTAIRPHFIGDARLNGKKIRVLFDSGASRSLLTLAAAERAGITPQDEGVTAAGVSYGIGRKTPENWLARFDTLDLGGELIRNAQLRIGRIGTGSDIDMLLGADFFLSHRIYVASKQNKLYFTYNGGPVFDLRQTGRMIQAGAPASSAPAAAEKGLPSAPALDPEALRRRGAASLGRGDTRGAIRDLDAAIKLDPNDPDNYYQRGLAHWQDRSDLAMPDFDRAVQLKPDHVSALVSRGTMRLDRGNQAGALEDFEAAARAARNDATLSLRIAQAFVRTSHFEEAITRLSAWISANPRDDRLAVALNDRCRSRAMLGKELDLAIADCAAALKKGPRNSMVYESRAFSYLRHGEFSKAIDDYKAALELQPKMASSLYGLGIAELRMGLKKDGKRHIRDALAADPDAGEVYERIGLKP